MSEDLPAKFDGEFRSNYLHYNPDEFSSDNPISTNVENVITETIVWHRYPDEKPPEINAMYMTCRTTPAGRTALGFLFYDGEDFTDLFNVIVHNVIAWAELPRGWVG